MLHILTTIIQVFSSGMLPILTSMMKGVHGQLILSLTGMKGILQKDYNDDGLLQAKFWLQTDDKVKIYLKMEWSLSWSDSGKLGTCSK